MIVSNRVKRKLQQANTWLVIALLALVGWTVDALRLFLEMHETFWAGLGAFASHFWYAVPMTLAVIILTRLQPKAKLLGLAVYDEAGHLMHHQGDFHLDELAVSGMLAALLSPRPQAATDGRAFGLHSITLPSGVNVYFVRDGRLTLMASFSGSPPPQELEANMQKLKAGMPSTFSLLDGLEPSVAALAVNLLTSPLKRSALAFFRRYSRTAMQAGDLAYWLGVNENELVQALEELADLNLLQRRCACDLTFYRLNDDPKVTAYLDRLFTWRNEWQMTLDWLEQSIGRDHMVVPVPHPADAGSDSGRRSRPAVV